MTEVRLYGSRSQCPTCGLVFSGEASFDRHRVGRFEPDEHRCLTPEEMIAAGLFLKPSGVWGRRPRMPVPAVTDGSGRTKPVPVEAEAEGD